MDDTVEAYLTGLAEAEHDDPVLAEMEAMAAEHDFPIVGRATGRYLELAARMIGAHRVMELGSGFGYSAYWFARAVGEAGEVVCTDGNPDNATKAEQFLSKAGLWDRVRYRVGGLWLCDNVIWSGHVATATDRDGLEGWTAAIRQHNAMVAEDDRYVGSIIPIRDGVMTALRIR